MSVQPLSLRGAAAKNEPTPKGSWRAASISASLHAALGGAIVFGGLLGEIPLPEPEQKASILINPAFVSAAPPPPAPATVRVSLRARTQTPVKTNAFVAPQEVPDTISDSANSIGPTCTSDCAAPNSDGQTGPGIPDGDGPPGSTSTAVPLPSPDPPAIPRAGIDFKEPKLIHRLNPEYPALAKQVGATAIVIIDAEVGPDGRVRKTTILRGSQLFDAVAVAAVREWRYQPLLLNGVHTPFVVTVTVNFTLSR